MDRISKLERAKKRLSPAEIRTLFADLAEPFVPGLGAVREGMAGNYGTAAVSGLLDFGGPIGKGVGLAALPMMGMIRKAAPQDEALKIAQRNAAKPVSEGGLGLPKNNTRMDRAKAMGFDKDIYHATAAKEDYVSINPSEFGKIGPGVYTSFEPKYTERYASGEGSRILPLLSKGKIAPDEVVDSVSQSVAQLLSKNGAKVNVADWKRITNEELQKLGYSGRDVGKERLIFEPKNLRSRFAAFDPARINEKDLLASLAALGIGLPVASGLLGEEQY
jgi:hypothetical protein